MELKNKKIFITGASFIGFYLIKRLINLGVSYIRVVNLTDKNKNNLVNNFKGIEFYSRDLRDVNEAKKSVKGMDIVFHLAADHGGRGYVALKQSNTATNFILDGSVFKACLEEGIEKVFYASSGCVYPNYLQMDKNKEIYLKESDIKPPYDADNVYGWAKLMGELVLKQYYKDYGLRSVIGRFFTVYGPYAKESHAVMATIAKAFIKQDPFEIWGDGQQIRNWTYVEDIVDGIIKLVAKVDHATAINLGINQRIRVIDMVNLVFRYTGFYPKKIKFLPMPTGPLNRVADITLAKKILNWQPKYDLETGLKKTIEWYFKNKDKNFIKNDLKKLLI